jgi:hypothetical protein
MLRYTIESAAKIVNVVFRQRPTLQGFSMVVTKDTPTRIPFEKGLVTNPSSNPLTYVIVDPPKHGQIVET